MPAGVYNPPSGEQAVLPSDPRRWKPEFHEFARRVALGEQPKQVSVGLGLPKKAYGPLIVRWPQMQKEIDRLRAIAKQSLLDRYQMDNEEILGELAHLGRARVSRLIGENHELLPVEQWPAAERAAVNKLKVRELKEDGEVIGYIKELAAEGKLGALTTLAEITGLKVNRVRLEALVGNVLVQESVLAPTMDLVESQMEAVGELVWPPTREQVEDALMVGMSNWQVRTGVQAVQALGTGEIQ